PPLRVHKIAIPRRVDLDVVDALTCKTSELRLHDLDYVPQQRCRILVNTVGDSALERDCRELRGARQRHLDRARAVRLEKGEFVSCQRPHRSKLRSDDASNLQVALFGVSRL